MKLIKSTEFKNDILNDYYRDSLVRGSMHMQIQRQGDFHSQYSMQSEDYVTYLLVDEKNPDEILAMATIVFREGWILGEKHIIGFATDLRVSPSRKVILNWSDYLLPAMEEEKEKRKCKYVFSVVSEGQIEAFNAFVRPRQLRRNIPRYYLYEKFDIIGIHGQWPFAPKPLNSITTRFAAPEDIGKLSEYIAKKMARKTMSFNSTPEAFLDNLKRWDNLEVENFLIAVDKEENIVGCMALWNSSAIEHFVPVKYDSKILTLKEALHFLSYFGISKRLPAKNEKLNFNYVSYLLADNPDIFYSMLHRAYRSIESHQFLIYSNFLADLITEAPKSFMVSRIKAGLYLVLPPEEPVPEFIKPKLLADSPDYELAFL